MSDIKRYDPGKYGGDYVTYADHVATLAKARTLLTDAADVLGTVIRANNAMQPDEWKELRAVLARIDEEIEHV